MIEKINNTKETSDKLRVNIIDDKLENNIIDDKKEIEEIDEKINVRKKRGRKRKIEKEKENKIILDKEIVYFLVNVILTILEINKDTTSEEKDLLTQSAIGVLEKIKISTKLAEINFVITWGGILIPKMIKKIREKKSKKELKENENVSVKENDVKKE